MTNYPQPPDIEKVKLRASKIEAVCQRADANLVILDEVIRLLEEHKQSSPIYQFQLNRAKRLLNCE